MLSPFRALTAALLLLLSAGCMRTAPSPAAGDADPALWVVRDEDTTIYLFGTVHVLRPGLTWFDEAVRQAFDASGEVVLELVMPDREAMQALVAAKGMTAAGPTLTERLPPDKRAAYVQALAGLGLPAGAFDRAQPWYAATNLAILPLMKLGYDPANGPEETITEAARAAGKPVLGLETAEQQLGYFASLSDGAQIKFLTSTVEELPTLDREMARMVDSWAGGKPEELAKVMNEDLADSPELAEVLLFSRNRNWAKWIEQRMQQPGTVFVAVGAGHLAGAESVQAQLARDGVKSRRVQY